MVNPLCRDEEQMAILFSSSGLRPLFVPLNENERVVVVTCCERARSLVYLALGPRVTSSLAEPSHSVWLGG